MSHQPNHMSHLQALFYLLTSARPPTLRRLPPLSSRTSRHQTPHSRCQPLLLPCLHTARRMRPHTLPPFLHHPSPYRRPRQTTLRLPMPHHSPLTMRQIYRTLTYSGATRLPSLFRGALPSHKAPPRTQDQSQGRRLPQLRPRPRPLYQ